ncbi:hypothetical protein BD410DRAFT_162826 [Rickenella mellea]|uniref:HNH domain-containing protein n=1 Tax=Rickenella mellea TaxID=50990 RepID=A0A4Y7Q766_9AGAM|nr:hypothetical protein BD410DRAFT_162826 [Rickenella mellea]
MDSDLEAESSQFSIFKDCFARRILAKTDLDVAGTENDDLDDFTSYLCSVVWPSLPEYLRNLPHGETNPVEVDTIDLDAVPVAFIDTLISYGMADDRDSAIYSLRKVLEVYVDEACAPLPPWSSTRTNECEICERAIPLTYHHLIPRSVHDKVLKRKWHPESMINSVAWLCRQCHSAVHGVASNEKLAREYYTVELLLGREDIQKWKKYAAKQRYGRRRG